MLKGFLRDKTRDMLEQKRKNLNTYVTQFNEAISAVTDIIDTLTSTSSNIEKTIEEINEYQNELSNTTKELNIAKEKNDKVIKNFKALIAD